MAKLYAPFAPDVVEALNRWQACGWVHGFTCGNRETPAHAGTTGLLVAERDGWRCPRCSYRQGWAHDFMLTVPEHPGLRLS